MTAPTQGYRGATATLCLGPLRTLTEALYRCRRQLEQGLRFVELRDDLLSDQELTQCARALPREQTLLSLRRPRTDHVALVDLLAEYCDYRQFPFERVCLFFDFFILV